MKHVDQRRIGMNEQKKNQMIEDGTLLLTYEKKYELHSIRFIRCQLRHELK